MANTTRLLGNEINLKLEINVKEENNQIDNLKSVDQFAAIIKENILEDEIIKENYKPEKKETKKSSKLIILKVLIT